MNEETIAMEHPISSEQVVTCEEGSISLHQPMIHRVGMLVMPCFFGAIYLAVAIFLIVLFYRLVRATEKIASKLESGITLKKDDSNNTI